MTGKDKLQELREACRAKGLRGYPVAKMDADTCERFLRGELDAAGAYRETAERHPENAHLQAEVSRKLAGLQACRRPSVVRARVQGERAQDQAQDRAPEARDEAPAPAPAAAQGEQGEGAQRERQRQGREADPRRHWNWPVLLQAARAMGIPLEQRIEDLERQLEEMRRAAERAAGSPAGRQGDLGELTWDGDYGVDPAYVPGEAARTALALMQHGKAVFLVGPAGSGKSMALRWAAQQLGRPMVFVSMHEHVMADTLEGYSWLAVEDGVTVQRWCPGVIEKALRLGAVLIVDEFDRAPAAVQHLLNDVLQSRSYTLREGPRAGEKVRAADGFLLVATGNTTNGSTGQFTATAIDRSTLSRFRVLFVDYDRRAELELLHRLGLNGKSEMLLRAVERAREEHRRGNLPTAVGTRHLVHVAEDLLAGLDLKMAWQVNVAAHQGEHGDPAFDAAMRIIGTN
jgi:MoxR-like ATPase